MLCVDEATWSLIGTAGARLEAGSRRVDTMEDPSESGIRARGEEALTELAQALAENPLVGGALARALGAGERAAVAQRQAIGALNLASTSDFERLELRLRSFSSRLEALEDAVDEIRDELAVLRRQGAKGRAQGSAD